MSGGDSGESRATDKSANFRATAVKDDAGMSTQAAAAAGVWFMMVMMMMGNVRKI